MGERTSTTRSAVRVFNGRPPASLLPPASSLPVDSSRAHEHWTVRRTSLPLPVRGTRIAQFAAIIQQPTEFTWTKCAQNWRNSVKAVGFNTSNCEYQFGQRRNTNYGIVLVSVLNDKNDSSLLCHVGSLGRPSHTKATTIHKKMMSTWWDVTKWRHTAEKGQPFYNYITKYSSVIILYITCNVYYIETVAFKYSDSSNLFPSLYLVFLTNNSKSK